MFSKKVTDNRSKNTKRKITKDLFEQAFSRDKGCVICWTQFDLYRPHHAYYWIDQNLWENRNDLDQVVTICRTHHHKLHFEWGNNYREEAIEYLKNYYENNSKG